jgi:uncharacterized protein YuzE
MERWTWDGTCDVGYVHINSDLNVCRTVGLTQGMNIDLDQYNRIVGVEVLDATSPEDMLSRLGTVLEYCRYAD